VRLLVLAEWEEQLWGPQAITPRVMGGATKGVSAGCDGDMTSTPEEGAYRN
jgi:hypothetical protein